MVEEPGCSGKYVRLAMVDFIDSQTYISLIVADTISHSMDVSSAIWACSAGSAREVCAYELLRSSQSNFILYRVGFTKTVAKIMNVFLSASFLPAQSFALPVYGMLF